MVRVAKICGRIIDRNHGIMHCSAHKLLGITFEIDQELEDVVKASPQLFAPPQNGSANSRSLIQLMYYHVRTLLHLPLMIKSAVDTRFLHGKLAAVEAARNMILSYREMRTDRGRGMYSCKMVDFEVFTAAMILILNIYGYSREDTQSHEADWNLIDTIINLLKSSVHETGGKVSEQCLRTLELFAACRKDKCHEESEHHQTAKVVIPFYGTLVLGPNRNSVAGRAALDAKTKHKSPEGLAQLPTPSCTDSSPATSPNTATTPQWHDSHLGEISFDLNQGMFPYSNWGQVGNDGGGGQMVLGDQPLDTSWSMNSGWNTDLDADWTWLMGGDAQA